MGSSGLRTGVLVTALVFIAFFIGYSWGYSAAIDKCIEVGEKVLHIEIREWAIYEIKNRIGGIEFFTNENSSLAMDQTIL